MCVHSRGSLGEVLEVLLDVVLMTSFGAVSMASLGEVLSR